MTIADLLNSVKFVVGPDGRQSAVVVDWDVWEQIVTLLEDTEDAEEIKKARTVKEETIPWKAAKKEIQILSPRLVHRDDAARFKMTVTKEQPNA